MVRVSERARVCVFVVCFGLFADTNIKWRMEIDLSRPRRGIREEEGVEVVCRLFIRESFFRRVVIPLETRTKRLSHLIS